MRRRTLCKYRSKLELQSFQEFSIDESKPYAELWMGTHPKSPAVLSSTGERLADHISANPESELGKHVTEKFGSNLPFLLKILSVNQALSIQGNSNIANKVAQTFFQLIRIKNMLRSFMQRIPHIIPTLIINLKCVLL